MTDRIEPPWPELDDGIRSTVRMLWDHGFTPTDSGDGSKFPAMECAFNVPHVFMQVLDPRDLVCEAMRLHRIAKREGITGPAVGPMVQANYSPDDGVAMLELWGRLP